jgi:hypothetical protein
MKSFFHCRVSLDFFLVTPCDCVGLANGFRMHQRGAPGRLIKAVTEGFAIKLIRVERMVDTSDFGNFTVFQRVSLGSSSRGGVSYHPA